MTNIDEARESIKIQMERDGKSQAELARTIGCSAGAISLFLKGTYTGDNEQLANKILKALEVDTRRKEAVKTVKVPEFVETEIYKDIKTVIEFAHDFRDIGLIYGEAGLGKTVSLRKYAQETPGTILITADVTVANSKAILEEILDRLSKETSGDRRKLRKQVVNALKDTGRLIIIDEAQHLQTKAIETIRSLHDECGIPIILCGGKELHDKVQQYPQLWSRIGIKRELSRTKIKKEDIKMIFEQEADIPSDCLNFLHHIATDTPWGIRLTVKLFLVACKLAYQASKPLDKETLEDAYSLTVK